VNESEAQQQQMYGNVPYLLPCTFSTCICAWDAANAFIHWYDLVTSISYQLQDA